VEPGGLGRVEGKGGSEVGAFFFTLYRVIFSRRGEISLLATAFTMPLTAL
jgi:hypothetical protein